MPINDNYYGVKWGDLYITSSGCTSDYYNINSADLKIWEPQKRTCEFCDDELDNDYYKSACPDCRSVVKAFISVFKEQNSE